MGSFASGRYCLVTSFYESREHRTDAIRTYTSGGNAFISIWQHVWCSAFSRYRFHPEDSWTFLQRSNAKKENSKRKAESPTKRCTSGCKRIVRLCGARSCRPEEARFVGCWQGGDCEGGEEAMGEGQEAGEEGYRVV